MGLPGLQQLARIVALAYGSAGIASCFLFPAPDDRWTTGDADATIDPEASVSPDADASIDRDAATSAFCTSNPGLTFCADFDGMDLTAGWTSSVTKSGTLTAESARYVSPPRSVHLTADRAASDASPFVVLFRDLPSAGAHAHLELDVFVARLQGDTVQVFQLARGPNLAVSLSFGGAGAYLTEEVTLADGGAYSRAHAVTAQLSQGAWHHVVFDILFAGDKTMSLRIDEASALGTTPLSFAGDAVGAGRLRLGIGYASAGSYDLLLDNVALQM